VPSAPQVGTGRSWRGRRRTRRYGAARLSRRAAPHALQGWTGCSECAHHLCDPSTLGIARTSGGRTLVGSPRLAGEPGSVAGRNEMASVSRQPARYLLLLVILALAAGLVLAGGAGAAGSASPSPAAATVLKVGWDTEPDNLNPFVGYEQSSFEIFHLEYDFLTNYGAAHLETRPGLATSWTHTPDGLTWTFTIRRGATWQDGVPLTAHDIAFTYTFMLKYKLQAFMASLEGVKAATAPNDTTVVITCSRPKADILSMWVPILPEHVWGKFHSYSQAYNYANKPPIVGSGPFQVVQWVHGQYIRCVANKHYWGGAPKVDQLIFSLYTDQMTMASDLRSGVVQLAIDLPPAQIKGMQSDQNLSVQACSQKAFDYLSFNCYTGPSGGNPVLRDWRFRQALNWAVDKQKIVALANNGYATAGSSLFEPNFYSSTLDWHWTPPTSEAYTFDLKKAGDMLTAAGYPLKNGARVDRQGKPIVLRLWGRTSSPQSQVMGKLITAWFSQLGLKIKFSVHDDAVLSDADLNYVGKTYKPTYDMYIWYWLPSGSDPQRRLGYFTTDQIQNNNDCCWSNAEYDRLFHLQSTTIDQQQRKQIVWQMEKIFYEQTPYVVLDYPKLFEGWNTGSWQGWERIPQPDGAVAYISDNVDNYRLVSFKTGATTGGGLSTGSIVAIVVVVAVALAGVVVLIVRRSRRPAEEV
jgi:peptide/nickel transport system substrate-binding protein